MTKSDDTPISTRSKQVIGARALLIELVVNVGLPFAIYIAAEARFGEVHALMLSSAPPVVFGVLEYARRRRVDAISLLSIGGIMLSLLAFYGGGSVQLLQLREKLVTGLIGVAFFGSVLVGRPLIFELARAGMMRKSKADVARFNALAQRPRFKSATTMLTLVWGAGLLADVALSMVLVFALSVRAYLIVNPVLGYATLGGLSLWTFWYARRNGLNGHARETEIADAHPDC